MTPYIFAAVLYLGPQHLMLPALRFEDEETCQSYARRVEQEAEQSGVRVRWQCSETWRK